MSDEQAAASAEQWASAMKIYAATCPEADLADRAGLSVFWADSPFSLWNGLLLNQTAPAEAQFHSAVADAVGYMRCKQTNGLLYVCEDLVSGGQLEDLMASFALVPRVHLTGMIADLRLPAPAPHSGMRIARVDSQETASHFSSVIGEVLNISGDICDAEFVNKNFWRKEAYAFVSYYRDEVASISSIIVDNQVLYIGLVATRASLRNKGLSYATNLYMLGHVRDATGLSRAALHATSQGLPVYAKLGFRPVSAIVGLGFDERRT